MTTIKLIYLLTYTLAFIVGVLVYKYHKALKILIGLLALGLITEYTVNSVNAIVGSREAYEELIYNIYIPAEYILYALFFYCINTNKLLKKVILWSFPLFVIITFILYTYVVQTVKELRTDVYIVSGILTILWSICSLFLIKPLKNITFIQHPLFWICTGLIIFYAGILPFNVLFESIKEDKILAPLIRKGFNIWLYSFIIIGFIYSHRMKTKMQQQ